MLGSPWVQSRTRGAQEGDRVGAAKGTARTPLVLSQDKELLQLTRKAGDRGTPSMIMEMELLAKDVAQPFLLDDTMRARSWPLGNLRLG